MTVCVFVSQPAGSGGRASGRPGAMADETPRRHGTGFASSLMGSAVKAAKGALAGKRPSLRPADSGGHSPMGHPQSQSSQALMRGAHGKSAATLDDVLQLNARLLEHNTALRSQVSMWQGKYDALERTCQDMEHEITRLKESKKHFHSFRSLNTRSPTLTHRVAFASPRLTSSQSLILTPDPMLADRDPAGPAPCPTASVGPHLARQGSIWVPPSPMDERGRYVREQQGSRSPEGEREGSVSPLEPGSPLGMGGAAGGDGRQEAAGAKQATTTRANELCWGQESQSEDEEQGSDEESEHWLEYVVHLGVSARTAYMIWQDGFDTKAFAARQQRAGSDGAAGGVGGGGGAGQGGGEEAAGEVGTGRDAVSCIPEMLWCYPRAPAVQELELFVFPKQVPVRLEHDDTWRALMQEQSKAQQEETICAVSEGILARRAPFWDDEPPAAEAAEEVAGAGTGGGQPGKTWYHSTRSSAAWTTPRAKQGASHRRHRSMPHLSTAMQEALSREIERHGSSAHCSPNASFGVEAGRSSIDRVQSGSHTRERGDSFGVLPAREEGAAREGSPSSFCVLPAQEEGAAREGSPSDCGLSEGERAGVDKFVFVLSTHENGGEALYGVCVYWDEPCYLVMPGAEDGEASFSMFADSEPLTPTNTPLSGSGTWGSNASPGAGQGGGAVGAKHEKVQLLTSRKCLCLLSRLPVLAVHEAVLERCVRDRAQHVAQRMAQMLASSAEGGTHQTTWRPRCNSFGVQDWWGLGNAPSPFARALLRCYRRMSIPSPDKPLPTSVWVKGSEIPLLPRCAAARGGATVPQPRDGPDQGAGQYQQAVTTLLGYLSLESIVSVVSALLLERRVVVECSDPLILSAVAMALPQLIRPYKWLTHFIPFLPPPLVDFLLAPVPFLAGVLAGPQAGYEAEHIVLVVHEDKIMGAEALPMHPALKLVAQKLGCVCLLSESL